ncbi:MAG: DUF501 domain-containing protein [Aquificae bacterium]|nr:DUF501 domain-containing protein [Aquificota bacterium]
MKTTKPVVQSNIIEKSKTLTPNPTRFWILEKNLRKKISQLEEKGTIIYLSKKFTKDKNLFITFINLHKLEIKIRKQILKEKYPDIFNSSSQQAKIIKNVLLNTGIGGIRDFKTKPLKIKCLHLWTAYHLGDKRFENPIGEYVLDKIG